jgi:alpha-D-ribose 1-methylphosphonate 5-triphosphate synthase subunit PhnH
MQNSLDLGFAEPVLQAQTSFRAIMDALANPGSIQNLTMAVAAPAPLATELAIVALTLCDHDTAIWLDDPLAASQQVRDFLGFHTGAPIVAEPLRAQFAFATSAATLPALDQFNLGMQDYPDRSTTIVLQVQALSRGAELVSRGPGIKQHGHIAPIGLPVDFAEQWAANRALFPRGIDLLLLAPGQVMGLPRSTRLSGDH